MRVAYVTWAEGLDSSILQAQVLDMCKTLVELNVELEFIYFSAPSYAPRAEQILKKTLPHKTKISVIPVWFLAVKLRRFNWIFLRRWQATLVKKYTIWKLSLKVHEFDIMHFRSYPISQSIASLKQRSGRTKYIFDPRSPYPDECVTLNILKANSSSDAYWRLTEQDILNSADCTIATTASFGKELKAISKNANIEVVPNNVSIERFRVDEALTERRKKALAIPKSDIVFAYVGSLGENSWNNPQIYAQLILLLQNSNIKFCFLFITNNGALVDRIMTQHQIPAERYRVTQASFKEVPEYLSIADIGVNLMMQPDPRLSVKTVEYFAAGLPLLTNKNASGVAELVSEQNLGVVLKGVTEFLDEDLQIVERLIENKEGMSALAKEYAKLNCSTLAVTKKYLSIYERLLTDAKER